MIPGILLLANLVYDISIHDWRSDCYLIVNCDTGAGNMYLVMEKQVLNYLGPDLSCVKLFHIIQLNYEINLIDVSLNLTIILIIYNITSRKL